MRDLPQVTDLLRVLGSVPWRRRLTEPIAVKPV